MTDSVLRAAERAWRSDPNPTTTAAYDRACRRAGVPSPPLAEARDRLSACLRAVLREAFDPAYLVTPCCGNRARVGPPSVHDFSVTQNLLCPGCTFSRRTPEGERRLRTGRTRLIARIRYGTEPDTNLVPRAPVLEEPGAGGLLHPNSPAPWPTRFLATLLRAHHITRPAEPPFLLNQDLLEIPLSQALHPPEPCHRCGYQGFLPGPSDEPQAIVPCPEACLYAGALFQIQERVEQQLRAQDQEEAHTPTPTPTQEQAQ